MTVTDDRIDTVPLVVPDGVDGGDLGDLGTGAGPGDFVALGEGALVALGEGALVALGDLVDASGALVALGDLVDASGALVALGDLVDAPGALVDLGSFVDAPGALVDFGSFVDAAPGALVDFGDFVDAAGLLVDFGALGAFVETGSGALEDSGSLVECGCRRLRYLSELGDDCKAVHSKTAMMRRMIAKDFIVYKLFGVDLIDMLLCCYQAALLNCGNACRGNKNEFCAFLIDDSFLMCKNLKMTLF